MKEKFFDGGLQNTGTGTTPIVLGIDQSYTGFGLTVMARDFTYRTWVMEWDSRKSQRLMDIYHWLDDKMLSLANEGFFITETCMEGPALQSQMAHMMGELHGIIKLKMAQRLRVPWVCTPSRLKKWIIGNGNKGGKNLILLSVYKHWGVEFDDDNAADSYGLARLAWALDSPLLQPVYSDVGIPPKVVKAQTEVIRDMLKEEEDGNSRA